MDNQTVLSLKTKLKQIGMTYEQLSVKSGIPLNTLKNVFSGRTENPRIDTIQAIERALGLVPTFTEEERALGLSDSHAVVLSDSDRELIHLFSEAEEKLGLNYVKGIKQMIRLAIDSKERP